MGVCFSKKKEPNPPPPTSDPISNGPKIPIPKEKKSNIAVKAEIDKIEYKAKKEVKSPKQETDASASAPPPALPVEKKPVFVITQTPKKAKSNSTANSEEENKARKPDPAELVFVALSKAEEIRTTGTVRTSSCTKEEVDAILIQCGRLSRSSSGKASSDTAGHKKYSGSKRSYDFDNDKSNRDEEEDWDQKPVSRPSPRRRTPNRERSGSRERGSSQRRVSRSPGRRSETPAASSSSAAGDDKPKQPPAKMVSVPAREKGVAAEASGVKRANSTAVTTAVNRRNASPRSRSPANTSRVSNENAFSQPQSLSRSSSRKQDQSPCRRNPMTEIDDNSMRGSHSNNAKKVQKSSQIQTQKSSDQRNNISNCVRDQLMSCRAKENHPEPEIVEETKESKSASKGSAEIDRGAARTRSSRQSSRDLDHILGLNSDNTSLLLEDIQNYHQQNAGFSLPTCVSKACSILEAVADLNLSSSDQSNSDNARFGQRGPASKVPFLESEVVVKDDLMEPSVHKYISVRDLGGENEPQESAGSNSFVGQQLPSAWELNSVDSTDRYWNSLANNGEEVEETSVPETRVSRFRSGGGSSSNSGASATGSGNKKGDVDHHRQIQRGGSGVSIKNRAQSLPVAAATS